MNKINIHISKNSFLYLVIYGGIILIIILAGMFPSYLTTAKKIKENEKLKYQINEQKDLRPLYAALMNAVNDNDKDALAMSNPEKKPVSREEAVVKFQNDFRAIMKKSGLTVVSCVPDLTTTTSSSTSFLHNIVLKGQYADFRKIIIGLGTISYLDRVEEISCQQGVDYMEFKIKVWITVK